MNLQLPPDVAMQKKIQLAQQNQLYSLAFQIYVQLLSIDPQATFEYLACRSIAAANVFNETVANDVRSRNEQLRNSQ